jgi:hypothetical protein
MHIQVPTHSHLHYNIGKEIVEDPVWIGKNPVRGSDHAYTKITKITPSYTNRTRTGKETHEFKLNAKQRRATVQ